MSTEQKICWSKKQKLLYACYLFIAAPLPESRRFKLARKLRNWFARRICKSVDKTANIEKHAHFNPHVTVGKRSSLGVACEIDGPVTVGENVLMGPEAVILTRNHRHDDITRPMIDQGYESYKPVVIEDDVWIGRRVTILPGVTVAKGCILAAGAVVTKSTEPYCIYGGVPAKKIGQRG